MKHILLITAFLFFAAPRLSAQFISGSAPRILPPSPEAQTLFRFSDYPVNNSTGVPEIKIPLFNIQSGKLSLPINIMYHAGGNKVNDIASYVGLGWTLDAGGMVSRTVNDSPDDRGNGYLTVDHHTAEEINKEAINPNQDPYFGQNMGMMTETNYDNESDSYSYSVGGNINSSFVYDLANNITQLSFTEDKITRDLANDKFDITDSKGTHYTFSTTDLCSNTSVGSYTSSWFLTQMVSHDLTDTISFNYDYAGYGYDETTVSFVKNPDYMGFPSYLKPLISGVSFNHSVLLRSIKFKNGSVNFDYSGDRQDVRQYRLSSVYLKSKNADGTETKLKEYQFNQDYFISETTSSDPRNDKRLRLNEIRILDASGTYNNHYTFLYNTRPLPSYYDYNRQGQFQYALAMDYWGYYNGVSNQHLIPGNESWNAYREPVESYMMAGIIKRITYPTGGYSEFQFEANRSGFNSDDEIVGGLRVKTIASNPGNGQKGEKKTYEYEAPQLLTVGINEKSLYSYTQRFWVSTNTYCDLKIASGTVYSSETPLPLSLQNGSPVIYPIVNEYTEGQNGERLKTTYRYDYALDKADNIELPAYDVYYQAFADGHLPPKEGSIGEQFPRYGGLNYTDRSWERGNLISTDYYTFANGAYKLTKSISNNYETKKSKRIIAGLKLFQRRIIAASGCTMPLIGRNTSFYAYNKYADIGVKKLLSEYTLDVNNNVETFKTSNYTYQDSSHLFRTEKTEINSKGVQIKTKYTYPSNFAGTAPYSELVRRNVLAPVLSEEQFITAQELPLKAKRVSYKDWGNNIIEPEFVQMKIGTNPYENRLQFYNYNKQGQVVADGIPGGPITSYLYSYGGEYPIAEIKNTPYSTIESILGATNIETFRNKLNPSSAEIDNFVNQLRNNVTLKNAFVTSNAYLPLVGLTSSKDEKQKTNSFEYDGLQRLVRTKDTHGNITRNIAYSIKSSASTPYEYLNNEVSGFSTKNNCPFGYKGSTVKYTVSLGSYISTISQNDADQMANADIVNNAQNYANSKGECTATTVYYNVAKSTIVMKNNCPNSTYGSAVTYTIPPNTYNSIISQADADQKADNDIQQNSQTYANTHGICPDPPIYYNVSMSQTFYRNNCAPGRIGSGFTYTVPPFRYSSLISVDDANKAALAEMQTYGQNTANCRPCLIDWSKWVIQVAAMNNNRDLQVYITRPAADADQGAYVDFHLQDSNGNSFDDDVYIPASQTTGYKIFKDVNGSINVAAITVQSIHNVDFE